MTRKEAIKILSELAGYEKTMDLIQNYSVSVQDALHIAINSLEIDERYKLEYEQMQDIYSKGYNDGITLASYKIRAEIDRQEKWLLRAGYTAYNADIAFDAIKSVLVESEDRE